MVTICPKCNYQRTANDDLNTPDYRCPNCDIVYHKFSTRKVIPKKTGFSAKLFIKQNRLKILISISGVLFIFSCINNWNFYQQEKREKERIELAEKHDRERRKAKALAEYQTNKSRRLAECNETADCIGRTLAVTTTPNCQQTIEKQARYRFKWTDGFFSSPFTAFYWVNNQHDSLVAMGDQLQFESQFGAWQNQTYRCLININPPQIITTIVSPGRL